LFFVVLVGYKDKTNTGRCKAEKERPMLASVTLEVPEHEFDEEDWDDADELDADELDVDLDEEGIETEEDNEDF
jgi:hypothetical protein